MSGEIIHWAGVPRADVVFHSDDWAVIPFSLLWTGFFVFWEANALGWISNSAQSGKPDTFMILWGIPFLLFGNYLVWARFLVDAWRKRRIFYAITNRRVLIVLEGWSQKTSTTFLHEITQIEREGTDTGTLWFGPKYPVLAGRGQKTRDLSRFSLGDVPVFADIDDVDSVHRLILDLSEKVAKQATRTPLTYMA